MRGESIEKRFSVHNPAGYHSFLTYWHPFSALPSSHSLTLSLFRLRLSHIHVHDQPSHLISARTIVTIERHELRDGDPLPYAEPTYPDLSAMS